MKTSLPTADCLFADSQYCRELEFPPTEMGHKRRESEFSPTEELNRPNHLHKKHGFFSRM